jgi:proteasome assembly chaperone (PAC2) family protein
MTKSEKIKINSDKIKEKEFLKKMSQWIKKMQEMDKYINYNKIYGPIKKETNNKQ